MITNTSSWNVLNAVRGSLFPQKIISVYPNKQINIASYIVKLPICIVQSGKVCICRHMALTLMKAFRSRILATNPISTVLFRTVLLFTGGCWCLCNGCPQMRESGKGASFQSYGYFHIWRKCNVFRWLDGSNGEPLRRLAVTDVPDLLDHCLYCELAILLACDTAHDAHL